jgi:hypothetical protein
LRPGIGAAPDAADQSAADDPAPASLLLLNFLLLIVSGGLGTSLAEGLATLPAAAAGAVAASAALLVPPPLLARAWSFFGLPGSASNVTLVCEWSAVDSCLNCPGSAAGASSMLLLLLSAPTDLALPAAVIPAAAAAVSSLQPLSSDVWLLEGASIQGNVSTPGIALAALLSLLSSGGLPPLLLALAAPALHWLLSMSDSASSESS